MVPVTNFSASVHSILEYLAGVMARDNKEGSLSSLLAVHFLSERRHKSKIDWRVSNSLDMWILENKLDLDQAPLLATLGCLVAENSSNSNTSQALGLFVDGLGRLKQRQNIFISSNSWILSPEVVLGISLGVFSANITGDIKEWLKEVLRMGAQRKELPYFLRLIYVYCLFVSGQDENINIETTDQFNSVNELALDIWVAKRFSNYLSRKNSPNEWLEVSQSRLLEECLVTRLQIREAWKAAIVWYVISDYVHSRSQYPRLDLIDSTLSNFDPAMERWNANWKIENEYDIQAILWLILRSVFEDLRYEESFPKLGRSGHRYDIAVPQLGIVVEVKYTRRSGDFQKIVDEVSKDAVQITTQSRYKEIFVFVYDESCSVEHHSWAKDAIEGIERIKGCIIKSAPSIARPEGNKSIRKQSKT